MTVVAQMGFTGAIGSKGQTKNMGVEPNQFADGVPTTEVLPEYIRAHCEENGLSTVRARLLYCGTVDRKSIFELSLPEFQRYIRSRRRFDSKTQKVWEERNNNLKQTALDNLNNEIILKGGKRLLSIMVSKQSSGLTRNRSAKGSGKEPTKAKPYRKQFPKLLRGSQSHVQGARTDYCDALDALQEAYLFWVKSCRSQMNGNEDDKLISLAEHGTFSYRSMGMGRFRVMDSSRSFSQKLKSRCEYRDRLGTRSELTEFLDILIDTIDQLTRDRNSKKIPFLRYLLILRYSLQGYTQSQIGVKLGLSEITIRREFHNPVYKKEIQNRIPIFTEMLKIRSNRNTEQSILDCSYRQRLIATESVPNPVKPQPYSIPGFGGVKVIAQRDDSLSPKEPDHHIPYIEPVNTKYPTIGTMIGTWDGKGDIAGLAPITVARITMPRPLADTKTFGPSAYGYGEDDDANGIILGNRGTPRSDVVWSVPTVLKVNPLNSVNEFNQDQPVWIPCVPLEISGMTQTLQNPMLGSEYWYRLAFDRVYDAFPKVFEQKGE